MVKVDAYTHTLFCVDPVCFECAPAHLNMSGHDPCIKSSWLVARIASMLVLVLLLVTAARLFGCPITVSPVLKYERYIWSVRWSGSSSKASECVSQQRLSGEELKAASQY